MEVDVSLCLCRSAVAVEGQALECADGKNVHFRSPPQLLEAHFPVPEANFTFERVHSPGTPASQLVQELLPAAATNFVNPQGGQNTVVYAYGQRATPRRQFLFGSSSELASEAITPTSGIAQLLLHQIFQAGLGEQVLRLSGYVLGVTENIVDLLAPDNTAAVVVDSIKEGPTVSNVTVSDVRSYADAVAFLKKVAESVEEEFAEVLEEKAELEPFPPYNPFHTVLTLQKYPNPDAVESGSPEANSIHLIALGDSERPPLCGINLDQLNKYEKTHKTHTAVVGILGAIRCNRLRIPFTKSKLTSLLKRAYNAEKNNPFNEVNQPTKSVMLVFPFDTQDHCEETYHTLMTAKRIINVMGGGGVGPASRDLGVEKWRLEQDIVELKDELAIAKAVHDYKPCIYDQPKPVTNIQEAELAKIALINKKREESRSKAQAEMRQQAQREAQIIIEQEERKSNSNLRELEEKLKEKLITNSELNAERDRKVKEFDKQLEKIRKKKVEEEEKAAKLKEEIKAIEDELNARNLAIAKAQQQLEVLNKDHAKGREMILQGREETKEKRLRVYQQRKAQRQQWLKEIEETNNKVLEQVNILTREKEKAAMLRGVDNDFGEEEIKADIKSIQKFLPKLIDIDDPKPENEASEKIRVQLEQYFEQERINYEKKLQDEKRRKEELEKAAEMYKARIAEHQNRIKKDQLQEAMKKEKHLEGLVEQVIQYLEHGCRMTKIPSKGTARKRYFFISEDRKKILCCEMDDMGVPVNRKRPTTTVYLNHVKRVTLGQFTQAFDHYGRERKKDRGGAEEALDDDEGSYNPSPTQNITPQNLHKYFYRSFSFELKKGKTLDVITETDSDFEAWIVALKKLLCVKSEWEKLQDAKRGRQPDPNADPPPPIVWGIPLDVRSKPGAEKLMPEEHRLCTEHHVTPSQYLNAKHEILQKSQTSYVTVYDVRTLSSLDLPRSQEVYESFLMRKLIPCPGDVAEQERAA